MTPKGPSSISAEWIVPGDCRPIRDGVIRWRGNKIEAVGQLQEVSPAANHRVLGEVAVIPGLVNAFTELELTGLSGKLPRGRPLTQWLFAMTRARPTGSAQDAAVAEGAAQSLAAGTTALADVSYNTRSWKVLADTPLRKLCLMEISGIGPTERKALEKLSKRLAAGYRSTSRLRFGIAPHAPYSTSEAIYRKAGALARRRRWAIATRLAQSESERQFLLSGTGRFFEFLARLGMIDLSVSTSGCRPVEFARRAGLFEGPCILAHVNAVDDDELRILSECGPSVVYCPGVNVFFGITGHRYPEMLAAGINVALGTDSLACNDSLSMLSQMRRVRHEGRVDNETILRMGTINGAKALGWSEQIGSLTPGKQADWVVLEIPPGSSGPLEPILTTKTRVLQTVIAGKTAFVPEDAPQHLQR